LLFVDLPQTRQLRHQAFMPKAKQRQTISVVPLLSVDFALRRVVCWHFLCCFFFTPLQVFAARINCPLKAVVI
jgi:hypothetical protein